MVWDFLGPLELALEFGAVFETAWLKLETEEAADLVFSVGLSNI